MQNWIKTVVAAIAVSWRYPAWCWRNRWSRWSTYRACVKTNWSATARWSASTVPVIKPVKFTNQTITNMLRQFGVQLPNKIDPKVKNVAAVAVSATLPPMYSRGQTIDVTVSSIGDAKSIRGGTLLLTQLHGADGEVYAPHRAAWWWAG